MEGTDAIGYRAACLDIEATNRCNARCTFCPREELLRPLGDMPPQVFDAILGRLPGSGVRRIVFSGFGEPLLHPSLPSFVDRLRASFDGVIQVNTNGAALTPDRSRRLIDAGLDVLNVSFNGITAEEYERAMRGMRLARLQENLRGFLDQRGRRRTPALHMQSSMPGALEQKRKVLRLAAALGVERVAFYTFNNRAGHIEGADSENAVALALRFCYPMLFLAWDGTFYPCSHDLQGVQPLGSVLSDSLCDIEKRDYPLCRHCTICDGKGMKEYRIWRVVLRDAWRRSLRGARA